jgi:hypothetical protein
MAVPHVPLVMTSESRRVPSVLPPRGSITRAREAGRIHEGFGQHDRMTVDGLPIGAEAPGIAREASTRVSATMTGPCLASGCSPSRRFGS